MPKKLISFLGCFLIGVLLCFGSSLPRLPHHWVRALFTGNEESLCTRNTSGLIDMQAMHIPTLLQLLQEMGVSRVPFLLLCSEQSVQTRPETFPAGWFVTFVKQPILQGCSFDPSKSRGTVVLGWCLHSSERQCPAPGSVRRRDNPTSATGGVSSCPKTV